MSFERPDVLAYLPVVVLLLTGGLLWQWRRSRRLAEAYGGRDAARRLTGRALDRFPAARLGCALFAAVALALSAAGVRRDRVEAPPPPTPVDLIVALDVSHSMTGPDLEPSRFAVARDALQAVLDARVADRAALSLFAAWPYGLVPLTDDRAVVDYFAPWVKPEVVPQRDQGTALADVVEHAREVWRARARHDAVPVLLVLSDGEAHGESAAALDAVQAATEEGLRVWTAGVGTPEGAPLSLAGSAQAPLLDGSGARVVAGYDPDLLQEMARIGGGAFHELTGDGDADGLVADLRALGGGGETSEAVPFDPTLLLLLAALALLATDAILDSGALLRQRRRTIPAGGAS